MIPQMTLEQLYLQWRNRNQSCYSYLRPSQRTLGTFPVLQKDVCLVECIEGEDLVT